jgi:MFS superfamily sulfate permease-like transporter
MFAVGIAVGLLLSVLAIVMALVALSAARARRPGDADERVAALEERVRGLVYRVWKLEGGPDSYTHHRAQETCAEIV